MDKIKLESILKQGEKLEAKELDRNAPDVQEMIKKTIEKQEAVLKLKQVDVERLKLVVQL